ncbi:RNA polymerase sigma factor [Streptomyces salinarius]|uniref:RNA polymerase sigma factor n=1 Tax=Streptomyces salinarius TaxID=2762598 RepID=UPI0013DAAAA2|nr:sigma-70 family RNA polymerase sigma factor [Streptomyces salinarius]
MAEQMESRPRFSLLNPRDNGLQSTMVRHSTCQSPAECSWEEIFQHQDRLMRLVRRRLPSFQDAEDCVQETMARAAAHATLDRNRLGAFLTSVALRLCIDFYRDMDRRSRLLQRAALAETPGTTEEDVCDEDFGRWLLSQVQHLRGREQEVILARAKGISTAEFARMHNISVKAAEAAFTRGRARLKNACAKALEGCAR